MGDMTEISVDRNQTIASAMISHQQW